MGTATATTVSTVVSDYTMESGGMRKAKRIMPRNSGGDAANEPVIWFAFFSQKAGREYYYEPKSKTVTWVMPDDYQPYPNPNHRGNAMGETAEDQPELIPAPKVKRKVSWVTATSEARHLMGSEKKGQPLSDQNISDVIVDKTFGKKLLIGAACIIVLGGAFCLGRLSDSGLNAGAADLVDLMPQINAGKSQHVAEVHIESDATALDEREEVMYEEKLQGTPVDTLVHLSESIEVVEPEEVTMVAEVVSAQQQEDKEKEKAEEEPEPSPPPAPVKCKIPFAYIVSGECRRRSVPLFDAEAFSLLMMQ